MRIYNGSQVGNSRLTVVQRVLQFTPELKHG